MLLYLQVSTVSGTQYNYNCVSDNSFWGNIPKFAQDLAIKACAAIDKGTYVINGTNYIGIEGFHANSSIDDTDEGTRRCSTAGGGAPILAKKWWGWTRKIVLENTAGGSKYTGFYGW